MKVMSECENMEKNAVKLERIWKEYSTNNRRRMER
jgi:hypothetical protein